MYASLSDGAEEACIIRKLVTTLLQTARSPDAEKSIEAVKCLGELGPSYLSTIVLKTDGQATSIYVNIQVF